MVFGRGGEVMNGDLMQYSKRLIVKVRELLGNAPAGKKGDGE